ncbi:MAG: LptF/LptG family permease [Candidatus Omnitrophica bacterium]|nr:LptF/LptG family permease [Candidatus Omnitrophota bacterium]
MRILEKYVLGNFLAALVFCVLLLVVLGIIGDVLGFIDDIFKHDIPLGSILSFYFYLAPFAFVNMLPFACILSSAFVFNSLSKHHEVTAVIASGLSLWKLLRPVVCVTFILCIATFIINDRYVPPSMQKATRIKQEELETGKERSSSHMKNIAVYGKGDQIIFAKSYSQKEERLENVIIHKQDENNLVSEKISARLVEYLGDGAWMGTDVIVFTKGEGGQFAPDPEVYKKKRLDIREKPQDFSAHQWDPKFMSFQQLRKYLRLFSRGSPSTVRRLLVDLNYKLSFPFAALVTILVCVPFSIETGRANPLVGMVRGITVAMLYVPVMAVSLALGKGGVLPPVVAAWFSNVLFVGLGVYFIHQKS